MGLDINLNTSKIDISEEDGLNVDLYNDNIDISDDEADDIIIEITGLKSISKFIGLEDTPLYYDNGKFFKVEDNKIIYTDIEWKDIKGNVDDSPEIVKVISDLVDDITDDIIDEKITLHNHNRDAHPYIQDILQDNYNTLNTKIDEVGDELSQEISHLSDNLNTEIENRETADNTLSETIQNETLARIEADSTLQNNIGTLSDNLNTEINNRTNADNLLREDINEISGNLAQEILNRQTQDGILQGNIDAEALTRQNADTVLQNNINTLSQTVTDNDTAINNKVDGINTTLTNSINSLSNTVSSNYTTLDTKIDNTKNALDSDISDLSDTVTNNYNSLDVRITTNTGNIATNAGNITTINSKIPNQASSSNQLADKDFVNSSIATNTANFIGTFNSVAELEAYSGTLTNNDYAFVTTTDAVGNTLYDHYKWNGSEWLFEYELNNSSFTAQQWASINSGSTIENINQIATNTQAISTETENRQDADNNLQSQIDAITASSDVTDIVGTYSQLQAYDTSTLPPNSIIKVLQDEHQNYETTYYRWVITGGVGSWVLIGEEGPYYTKSEANSTFVPQTRTVNGKALSTNITLDANDVGALPSSTVIPVVDQTFDGTSANAQSGVAIAGAKFLQNTATGNSSITVNGTATAKSQAINIGTGSQATGNYGTALGAYSFGNASHALGLGNYAKATADYAIQLNKGTNNTSNSLCVGFNSDNYQLLDGTTGLIPDARLSSNIARTSQIPSAVTESTVSGWGFTKNIGTVTSVNNVEPDASGNVTIQTGGTVDQTFDSTSINAQSGVAIEGELTTHYVKSSAEDTSQGITSSIGYLNGIYPTMQMTQGNYQFIITTGGGATLGAIDNTTNSAVAFGTTPNGVGIVQGAQQALLTLSSNNNLVVNNNELATQDWVGGQGFITSADLPTNYVTTDTAQTITARKTFIGEKAIYFKQDATTNKLGFTLYNPSDTELGAFEYRPNTINGNALLNINTSYSNACYVGFRYWGTAVNIVAPKVATAGNYFIPTHITDGTNTVTASNNGTLNISSLLPDVSNFVTNSSLATTLTDYQPLLESGINIKTINNNSILGSGNLTLDGLPNQTGQSGKFLTTDGTSASWAETTKITIRDWSIS